MGVVPQTQTEGGKSRTARFLLCRLDDRDPYVGRLQRRPGWLRDADVAIEAIQVWLVRVGWDVEFEPVLIYLLQVRESLKDKSDGFLQARGMGTGMTLVIISIGL